MHSPEPWESERGVILAKDGTRIPPLYEDGLSDADAERIVACVNFCQHLPTKLLNALLAQRIGTATIIELYRDAWWHDGVCRECGHEVGTAYEHDDNCLTAQLFKTIPVPLERIDA